MKKLLGGFLLLSSLAFGTNHVTVGVNAHVGHLAMGSVAYGHWYHGYPYGWAYPGAYYANPYAYWNGYGYTYGYGYGPVYGYRNLYGAISYSASTGIYGWSTGRATLSQAQNDAAAWCANGADDCKNLMWFANSCAALSKSKTKKEVVGWAWNQYASVARSRAQRECSRYADDCVSEGSVCSY